MRSKLLYPLILVLSILFIAPAFAQTEDELVAKFLNKAEKKQKNKVGYLVFHGSYGKLSNDNDHNKVAGLVSPLVTGLNGSDGTIKGIYRSKEFYLGFGMMASPKAAFVVGFNYWLEMGSTSNGDFNLALVDPTDTDDHLGFELSSEVQVYGIQTQMEYYLMNQPDEHGILSNFALKANVGAGYYFANWQLWDGFPGYNLSTSSSETIGGKVTGKAPGFSAGISGEMPTGFGGLIVEAGARYEYLNFTKMRWYNDNDEEVVVAYTANADRAELDFSGPRVQFGLKRFFNW